MDTVGFPRCCTAVIILDFDELHISWASYREMSDKEYNRAQIQAVKDYIENALTTNKYPNDYDDYVDKVKKMAFIVATTSDEQPWAEKALRELGFKVTKPARSARHDTLVRLWWLPVQEWREKNGYEDARIEEYGEDYDEGGED